MTVTVQLEPGLESRLRLRATTTDRNTSDVIRAALLAYLDALADDACCRPGGADQASSSPRRICA